MPLATILTRSSSGRGSASSSSSIVKAPNFSRATAAVISMVTASLRERVFQLPVPVLRRVHDHLLPPGHELLHAAALHILELHHDRARGRPFAELVESDLADDRIERRLVDVLGELVVVERA